MVPALRGVKTGGPYRFVRHPMYAGYAIGHVGFLLINPVWWNFAVYGAATACQVVRLLAEEKLLSRSPDYQAFRSAVRYRLIPGAF
jgi:protein-S-isoprenylcysteine O-methyltransferase Ste14